MDAASPLLKLEEVSKQYEAFDKPTPVLKGVNLEVDAGASVAIIGPSGCGKSTLLNIAGGLDQPSEGAARFDGKDLGGMSRDELAAFRNASVGFVFQMHHLLPQCNVLENVLIPTLVHKNADGARERAESLLERVGLGGRLTHRPGQLSGGERQRAAVVRALINKPRLLLADEPTGSLNPKGAAELTQLMLELKAEENMALLIVTHAMGVAEQAERVFEINEGVLAPYSG